MTAVEVCEKLAMLRGFPADIPGAISAIAEIIDEFLPTASPDSGTQRGRLVRTMRGYNEWPGPAEFEAICRAQAFGKIPGELPEFTGYGKLTSAPDCPACHGLGYVITERGRYSAASVCKCGRARAS